VRRPVRYFISFVGVHRRSGEQVSEPRPQRSCTGRGRIRFLGSALRDCSNTSTSPSSTSSSPRLVYFLVSGARLGVVKTRGGVDHRRRHLCLVIPVTQNTYDFLSLTMFFIPSMIWLELILLLLYFILNYVMSIFRFIYFLYTTFIMVMIYLWINLKLKLLIFPT
jgi:hypothetical protein